MIYLYDDDAPPRPFCFPRRYRFQDVWATCIHPDDHKAFFDKLSMQLFRTPGHQSEFKNVLKVGMKSGLLNRLVCTHTCIYREWIWDDFDTSFTKGARYGIRYVPRRTQACSLPFPFIWEGDGAEREVYGGM